MFENTILINFLFGVMGNRRCSKKFRFSTVHWSKTFEFNLIELRGFSVRSFIDGIGIMTET